MFNRKVLFDKVRDSLFGGSMRQEQVNGINAIVDYWERRHKFEDPKKLAYILATAYHETARTMQPIYERGSRSYFKKYEPGTRIGKRLGNIVNGDGYRFRGRGFVQLTGRRNYAHAGHHIGVDLVKEPDAALELDNAVKILIEGMLGGWFTGKQLGRYINEKKANYVGARRVVNGLDRARLIASYARRFEAALRAARNEEQQQPTKLSERKYKKVSWLVLAVGSVVGALAAFWKEVVEWIGRIF